jgi:hypothetical protein
MTNFYLLFCVFFVLCNFFPPHFLRCSYVNRYCYVILFLCVVIGGSGLDLTGTCSCG